MSKAKQKGTSWETALARYFGTERRTPSGRYDRGDLQGIELRGKEVVVEAKNCKRYEIPAWLKELDSEMENAGTDLGILAVKLNGVGIDKAGSHIAIMRLDTFKRILEGDIDGEQEEIRDSQSNGERNPSGLQ